MKTISLFFMSIMLGCSGGTSSDSNEYLVEESAIYDLDDKALAYSESLEAVSALKAPEVNDESKIIKTANLEFETQDLGATYQRIMALIKANKAFLQKDNTGKQYSREFHEMIIRVPTENFQKVVDGISEGVNYFDQKEISRRDVGEEFVDLTARLKAKKTLEARYLELLTKAKNVEEMLQIERELANIREEIEAKQGRLNYLSDQVSMSTVYINFYKVNVTSGVTQSYGSKMGNALKGGWNGISAFFLGLLYIWPLIVILGLIVFFVRRYLKRNKAKAS